MGDSRKYIMNPEFKVEVFEKEILLYSVSKSKGVYLNETAYLVWEMCGKGYSVGEIITLLEETYPEQENEIRGDISEAIESLVENGALVIVDE